MNQLAALWPWEEHPAKDITGRVAEAGPGTGADCVGAFINVLWRSCGG